MDVGLARATDKEIFAYATRHSAVIVTKDEDFAIHRLSGEGNAAIIWLRLGNCSRAELIRWFLPLLPQVVALVEAGEAVIELR